MQLTRKQVVTGPAFPQVVAEVVRVLLAAVNLAGSREDSEVEQTVMSVLLAVLIRDLAPCLTACPPLAEVAVKLVTQIASGPASAAFKAVVTHLPTQDKLKLQVRTYSSSCACMTTPSAVQTLAVVHVRGSEVGCKSALDVVKCLDSMGCPFAVA